MADAHRSPMPARRQVRPSASFACMLRRSVAHHPLTFALATGLLALGATTPPAMAQQGAGQEAVEMDTLVVTASGYEQNILDAPATISVIDAEELRGKAYTNITDALRDVAGVIITGSGVSQGVSIRGMGDEFTLFLVDGRPVAGLDAFQLVRGASVGGNSVNLLPPLEAIERVEVIRGPASSLYGSDAMGGVINIITRKVNNEWSGSVSAEYTVADNDISSDGFNTDFLVNAPLLKDTLSLQLTGGYQSVDESTYRGSNSTPEYKQRSFGSKFGWNIDERNSVTFGNNFIQGDRSRTPGVSLEPDATVSATDQSRSVRNSYFVTHDGKYDNLAWNSYVNYDESENRTSGVHMEVLTLNTQATLFLENHNFVGGINYKDESLQSGETNNLFPDTVLDRYHWAAFLEDTWSLSEKFAVTLSGRYDHNENFGGNFSPKAYGVYHLTDNLVLKGGLTSGFKVASLRDAAPDYGFASNGGMRLGNPDLKPEESLNKEIGIAYSNRELGLNTSLTAYRTDYKNKLTRTGRICEQNVECEFNGIIYPANASGYTTTVNIDEAELKGVEHTLDYRIRPNLTYRHNYTWSETVYSQGEQTGIPLNNNPKDMFNASLYWDPSGQLTLWGRVNYRGKTSGVTLTVRGNVSDQFDPDSVNRAYVFYDAGLNFNVSRHLRLNAGIYNIANKLITTDDGYSSTLDGRRFVFSMTQRF